MGPVRIRHRSHDLGASPVILWISLGGKPKWLPLKFGYRDVVRTSPISWRSIAFNVVQLALDQVTLFLVSERSCVLFLVMNFRLMIDCN